MARAMRKLYCDAKEGVLVRNTDLEALHLEISEEIASAKASCVGHADAQATAVRTLAQQLSDVLRADFEVLRDDLRDARRYAEDCGLLASKQAKLALDNAESKRLGRESAAEAALEDRLSACVARLEGDIASCRAEAASDRAALEKTLQERAVQLEGSVERCSEALCERMDNLIKGTVESIGELERKFCEHRKGSESEVADVGSKMEAHSQQLYGELQEAIASLDRRLAQATQRMEDDLQKQRNLMDSRLALAGSDHSLRVSNLEAEVGTLRAHVAESASVATRKVEWKVTDVAQRLRTSKSRSIQSPVFCACGQGGLQLELHFSGSGPAGEEAVSIVESGNCRLSLRACAGTRLTFRLSVGSVPSGLIVHDFADGEPYLSNRTWFLEDQISTRDGSLQVSCEIVELARTLPQTALAADGAPNVAGDEARVTLLASGSGGDTGGGFDPGSVKSEHGTLMLSRVVHNNVVERVDAAMQLLRSHMLRRIEWRLEQASTLRACYPEGKCICSAPFAAIGIEGLQLVFYPSGAPGARQGYCSFFYMRPRSSEGQHMLTSLRVGKMRFDGTEVPELPNLYGRLNVCRFDGCYDTIDDTLLLVMEVQETPQEVLEIASQQEPWRTPRRPPGHPRESGSRARAANASARTSAGATASAGAGAGAGKRQKLQKASTEPARSPQDPQDPRSVVSSPRATAGAGEASTADGTPVAETAAAAATPGAAPDGAAAEQDRFGQELQASG
eukprot:TRINITY_DN10203_c1_g4_i3.p1 TRINITY_DN10203_c1_g4~~TRINITY_DN10203_c1_g4_i3.p1  ORF type:complete len:753 (+),score=206.17 TRINITY_DN10203_c1_g4_i3:53-2260(+)